MGSNGPYVGQLAVRVVAPGTEGSDLRRPRVGGPYIFASRPRPDRAMWEENRGRWYEPSGGHWFWLKAVYCGRGVIFYQGLRVSDNNEAVRAVIIGQVQQWVDSWAAGVPYGACPARAVLECLLSCELDERGKIVAGEGIAHGEDLILRGQSLRRCVRLNNREIPEVYVPPKTDGERLMARLRGDHDGTAPFGQRVRKLGATRPRT